jgi:hypothetical protein
MDYRYKLFKLLSRHKGCSASVSELQNKSSASDHADFATTWNDLNQQGLWNCKQCESYDKEMNSLEIFVRLGVSIHVHVACRGPVQGGGYYW